MDNQIYYDIQPTSDIPYEISVRKYQYLGFTTDTTQEFNYKTLDLETEIRTHHVYRNIETDEFIYYNGFKVGMSRNLTLMTPEEFETKYGELKKIADRNKRRYYKRKIKEFEKILKTIKNG